MFLHTVFLFFVFLVSSWLNKLFEKSMFQKKGLNIKWLVKMAWRDSRKNRSRLLLFISSVILGIAALVAIYSLADNLNRAINLQAASLIGADLEISNSKP